MSTNLDLVRSIVANWEVGDWSSTDWAHPDVELVHADGVEPDRWTGIAGTTAGLRSSLSPWAHARVQAEECRELDDERVLVLVRMSGRAKRSGLEMGQLRTAGAQVFHVRGGKVMRVVVYFDRERGLADLGLTPEGDASDARS